MLGKWIYYGIIEDQFDEFMIVDKSKEVHTKQAMENFDWDERYTIRDENVISSPIQNLIVSLGTIFS
jgi:hypothetical protein